MEQRVRSFGDAEVAAFKVPWEVCVVATLVQEYLLFKWQIRSTVTHSFESG